MIKIQKKDFNLENEIQIIKLRYSHIGAVSTFVGYVRNNNNNKKVKSINLEVYKEMALTQIFPSGWEIINTRFGDVDEVVKTDVPTYQDIRDDRVYTYFNLDRNKSKTFSITMNAAYVGKYYLPTVNCEAMYDDRIHARKPGQWVEVVK